MFLFSFVEESGCTGFRGFYDAIGQIPGAPDLTGLININQSSMVESGHLEEDEVGTDAPMEYKPSSAASLRSSSAID